MVNADQTKKPGRRSSLPKSAQASSKNPPWFRQAQPTADFHYIVVNPCNPYNTGSEAQEGFFTQTTQLDPLMSVRYTAHEKKTRGAW
jgi:hypothetical protein